MKPILFNTSMVQAILEGRKTVTRRLVKNVEISGKNDCTVSARIVKPKGTVYYGGCIENFIEEFTPYQVGDILYVRETWSTIEDFVNYAEMDIDKDLKYLFKCDDNGKEHSFVDVGVKKWRPSIHMPKEAARIFLKVTNVRVEKLQDINMQGKHEDILKEGYPFKYITGSPLHDFVFLWNSTIKKSNLDKYDWHANPWVWVIEFEKISKEDAYE